MLISTKRYSQKHVTDKGFTLVEIMVSITILGVLLAIAIPAYRDYMLRATLSEAFTFADEEKTWVEVYYSTNGRLPSDINKDINVDKIKQVIWTMGIPGEPDIDGSKVGTMGIVMDLSNFGSSYGTYNDTFHLVARVSSGNTLQWQCIPDIFSSDGLDAKFLPETCRNALDLASLPTTTGTSVIPTLPNSNAGTPAATNTPPSTTSTTDSAAVTRPPAKSTPAPVVQTAVAHPPEVIQALGAVAPAHQQQVADVLDSIAQDPDKLQELAETLEDKSAGAPKGPRYDEAAKQCPGLSPLLAMMLTALPVHKILAICVTSVM